MIVAGRFDLVYAVSLLSTFSAAPQVVYHELTRKIFGYLKKYPKIEYSINLQALTIDANYEKVQMKYDFVNKYAYFSEEIGENFTEPIIDEWDIRVFVEYEHGHHKVTCRSIKSLSSVVASQPQHGHQNVRTRCKPQHLVPSSQC